MSKMTKDRFKKNLNDLVLVFSACVITTIIMGLSWLFFKTKLIYVGLSAMFAICAFLTGWWYLYRWGDKFSDVVDDMAK